ncbi:LAFA_0G13784g1_1 [Lachancea sp. 'fantastica']|nr:LAFA_0G13784g1_1 [Lachancea sp. 'fantastica']
MAVKLISGAYQLSLVSDDELSKYIDVLKKYGIKELDTARVYPDNEEFLGSHGIPKSFLIDTKARGFVNGSLSKEGIIGSIKESFELLKVESVETFFLHSPDPDTPLEETLDTIGALYKEGKFKKFGISNYSPEDVRKIYNYNKEKGYVLPTVYQGNYNAFARKIEQTLFPVLAELKMSFYAYSPIAGGFLAKTPQQITDGAGRFAPNNFAGVLYNSLYNKPSLIKGLEQWNKIAEKAGITAGALAYRWVAHNSQLKGESGDGVIIGARNAESMAQNIEAIQKGPLDAEIVKEIDQIWEYIAAEAPLDNYVALNSLSA